jgi:hypothetical protein
MARAVKISGILQRTESEQKLTLRHCNVCESVCLFVRLSVYPPNPVVNFYQLRIKIIPLEAY